jgi:hypothetical protein
VLSRRKPIPSVMQPDMHTKDAAQSVALAGTRARLGVSQLWDIVPGECDKRGAGVGAGVLLGSIEPLDLLSRPPKETC